MNPKLTASNKTFWKFIVFSAVGAAIEAAINALPNVQLPPGVGVLIGAALKTALTYIKTEA